MTNPIDPTHLAARFLDLWQESLSAIAADAELLDAMNRSFAAFGFGAAAMAGFTGTYPKEEGAGFKGSGLSGFPFAGSPASEASGPSASSDHPSATEAQDARSSSRRKPSQDQKAGRRPAESRTTATSSSSADGLESVAELTERLRLLETRFASLASKDARRPRRSSSSSRGDSPGGPRRRSSS